MTSILPQSRNVELTCMHKKATTTMSILHITTELAVSTPTKQPNWIDILNIS